jgi:ribulose 1,5-bisphosphate synthetase/thiazole synthase
MVCHSLFSLLRSIMSSVDSECKYEPSPHERVWCIIGAGASGLVAMKELNEVGIKVSHIHTKQNNLTYEGCRSGQYRGT